LKKRISDNQKYIPPLIAIIIGLGLAVITFSFVRHTEFKNLKTQFTLDTQNRINAILRETDINLEVIQSLYSFFESSEEVTREEFHNFTKHQISEHPSIQTLEWIPRVTDSERHAFEKGTQAELTTEYHFTEHDSTGNLVRAAERKYHYPLYFVEPYRGNEAALGYDLASDEMSLKALIKSGDTRAMVASLPVSFTKKARQQYAYRVVLPVYRKHVTLVAIEEREENLLGFVAGIFNIKNLIDHALSYLEPGGLDIQIFDESEIVDRYLMYTHFSRLRNNQRPSIHQIEKDTHNISSTKNINIADHTWQIMTYPIPQYVDAAKDWHAWGASSSVFIIGLLVALYLNSREALVIKLTSEINYRAKAEKERKHLLKELEKKNEELEQIMYVTTHDLRSPLVNVEGYSNEFVNSLNEIQQAIESSNLSPEIHEKIKRLYDDLPKSLTFIQSSIHKMDLLISGLLKLSRLGRVGIKRKKLDMNKLISDVENTFEYQIKDKSVRMEISKLPSCMGDEALINQLFTNLIENAIKYLSPDRKGIISISGHEENGTSVYCVEDNGIGIAAEQKAKIFEIFYQLEPKKREGEGLGLTIINRIIDRHNGKIWVESELGKGSKFFVSLPKE
jgi:signal transduction histidine kinase